MRNDSKPKAPYPPKTLALIAATVGRDPRTVRKVIAGGGKQADAIAVADAMKMLGIDEPGSDEGSAA